MTLPVEGCEIRGPQVPVAPANMAEGAPGHVVRVLMSAEFVQSLVVHDPAANWSDHIRVTRGLPVGARLVSAVFDPYGRMLILAFEHESFPATGGAVVETPAYESYHCGAKPQ